MEWHYDIRRNEYRLTHGACRGVVWERDSRLCAALVECPDEPSSDVQEFATQWEAQAWCLAELAGLRAAGRCGR